MRGRLKIFLGYVSGVGKTFGMLEAARQRQMEGMDVVIAWLDPGQSSEVNGLARGMPVVPPGLISAPAGAEMDLDAVLLRKPRLAVVDNLAHHNLPGMRHHSRAQDVEELLEVGIDVYSTLNIQNLESLTDVVRQITGLTVDETVPDILLDSADELELVDLPADELLQRMREGKVRGSPSEPFYRKGNLTALRELTMRRAAMRVDDQMRGYMTDKSISGPWAAGERVMVAISSHPLGDRLVRAGRRLADSLNAQWFVVFVETPGHLRMSDEQRTRLLATMRVAEEMGARTLSLTGQSVAETLIEFARRENVTRILIGRPDRPGWYQLINGSLVERILRLSGSIEVFVIGGEPESGGAEFRRVWSLHTSISRHLLSLALTGGVTLLAIALTPWIPPANAVMFYLAEVVWVGASLGRGPAVQASFLSALAYAFFFTEPYYRLAIQDAFQMITLAAFLLVGLVVSGFAALLRDQVGASRQREEHSAALNELSRDLTIALSLDELLAAVVHNVTHMFGQGAAVLLPQGEQLSVRALSPGLVLSSIALQAADWTFQHRKQSGSFTDTFPEAKVRCLPLETRDGVVGVLAVAPREPGFGLSPELRNLLEGFARLGALAIERARLSEQASQAAVLRTTERLQTSLLNSISHDLRTPLATITGSISSLLEVEQNGTELSHEVRLDLLENASEEAERLNRLVGNLLDMTRLEAGAMRMKLVPGDIQDVIGAALERAARRLEGHPVATAIAEDLPVVRLDTVLMVQVLFNLLDNAAKYSPPGSPLEISAQRVGDEVEIRVADRGLGIPPDDLERVFGKFYRVQRSDGVPGTGLGLSICRGIVEAHGGQIRAENRPGGGVLMKLVLPVQDPAGLVQEEKR